MISLLVAFFTSFIATLLIIRLAPLHQHLSGDSDLSGPQKFHKKSVPRIGGVSIALGIFAAIMARMMTNPSATVELLLLVCSVPVFVIGFTEDLTKKISVKMRLAFTAVGALMLTQLLNTSIGRLDIPGLDYLLSFSVIATLLTIFAITGLANAYNIIDGFNGLSSMVGILTLLGITYIAFTVGDFTIVFLSLIMVGAILGFFVWNYPRGHIFLGDGGAYLIGFWIAALSVLLVSRHQNISPWFALLINAYPIIETLFTIYRRKIHQGKNPGLPDGIHFHTLIYRRILSPNHVASEQQWFDANSRTSPYLWTLAGLGIVPAVLWWQSTPILMCFALLFIVSYVWLYKRIVVFKTPAWMHP
ncbi:MULTISPECIES: glycosyltransferase [unclassified Polynucleobacter]|jgi:UDP-N-acetylmuramyl pentapeptide phosphotransferase/UDP-N-acetylglucosamine-1-phosphate transferase|uniref:MraY family glycosyltransferase n=1 Tax=unclassified Polynucleobacter TaxID=2640945 RepID=UPI000BCC4A17|nr:MULTISPECIES: glycosyltransferase [unclassified Polynucleobacter]OYY17201.1 MAG: glycosyl transferase [Polynucleobacter sp. 35-46-11]OZA76521.1 MAG: glycosyl transferase [Polynucleobacter sp. 39-46-10]